MGAPANPRHHYDLIITAPEVEFQPTHEEITAAIHAVIDKKLREASPDLIPHEGITTVEVISVLNPKR